MHNSTMLQDVHDTVLAIKHDDQSFVIYSTIARKIDIIMCELLTVLNDNENNMNTNKGRSLISRLFFPKTRIVPLACCEETHINGTEYKTDSKTLDIQFLYICIIDSMYNFVTIQDSVNTIIEKFGDFSWSNVRKARISYSTTKIMSDCGL